LDYLVFKEVNLLYDRIKQIKKKNFSVSAAARAKPFKPIGYLGITNTSADNEEIREMLKRS
jgi:hypothetical protein